MNNSTETERLTTPPTLDKVISLYFGLEKLQIHLNVMLLPFNALLSHSMVLTSDIQHPTSGNRHSTSYILHYVFTIERERVEYRRDNNVNKLQERKDNNTYLYSTCTMTSCLVCGTIHSNNQIHKISI